MKIIDTLKRAALRWRLKPFRDTKAFATLVRLGAGQLRKERPLPKPTPYNLRAFSRTTYCRRAINAVKSRVIHLEWEIRPIKGVKANKQLQQQIDALVAAFSKPNGDDSFRTLIEQVSEDYLVTSAGAIEHQASSDPLRPVWMWPVDAQSIQIFPLWSGDDQEARYAQEVGYGQLNLLRNDELVYMRANPSTETPYGYGPVEIAYRAINRLLGAQEYAGNVAGNASPAFMLAMLGASQDQINTMRQYWSDEIEGQGKTPIMGAEANGSGVDVKVLPLHQNNDSALFLQYQQMVVREIAAAFDLSPANLGAEEHQNKATAEVAEERDMDSAVRPLATLIASHLTREVIQGRLGMHQLEFVFLGLDRDDEKAGAEVYKIEYTGNAITPNEYRERRGMPPLKSPLGDMLFSEAQQAYGPQAVDNSTPEG